MLDLLNAMHSHFDAPLLMMTREWSWKLFCAQWVRLIEYTAEQRAEQEKRERDAAFAALREKTEREHSAKMNNPSY